MFGFIFQTLNLQLFAEAGTVVNATGTFTNAYDGKTVNRTSTDLMSPTMKTYYDTEFLENTREQLIFQQLGKKQVLPANHGMTVEWRKWNTLPDADRLQEAVIPVGKKFGMTSITADIAQYGEYVAVSDVLDLHAIDDVIVGATEELGAAAGKTFDKLVRAELLTGTNVMYSAGSSESTFKAAAPAVDNYITPTLINKVVTALKKANAPAYSGGKYLCVIHPSCTFDLRQSEEWIDCHKYMNTTEIFNGEIGELHGVRFLESTMCPVEQASSGKMFYHVMFFGKDAFATVDVSGAGMETIIKSKEQAGGPLNQFSTIGAKFSMGAKILYPERMIDLWCYSSYSGDDEANLAMVTQAPVVYP